MNIHFTDTELFEQLKAATLAKVRVGSHLYGTNNENSDEDFLYIYATSNSELNSFITTHHQLQYKQNNTDHNFVSLHSFLRNAINGDSPINFEVIQSSELMGTPLQFLHKFKDAFLTYTVIRSYNGLVKRDIKHYSKAQTDYEKQKRYGHIVRGILYTDLMLKKQFDFNVANQDFIDSVKEPISLLPQVMNPKLQMLQDFAETQRKLLNSKLETNTLGYPKIFNPIKATLLDAKIQHLMNSSEFKDRQHHLFQFDMTYFIDAFENWVSY